MNKSINQKPNTTPARMSSQRDLIRRKRSIQKISAVRGKLNVFIEIRLFVIAMVAPEIQRYRYRAVRYVL